MIFRNHFFMVKCICVRAPSLPRLATVLVWQRAVNRQPGYRSGNSKGRRPAASIFQKFWNFQKITPFFNFYKNPGWIDEISKSFSNFNTISINSKPAVNRQPGFRREDSSSLLPRPTSQGIILKITFEKNSNFEKSWKSLKILKITKFTQISRELSSSLYSSIWIVE